MGYGSWLNLTDKNLLFANPTLKGYFSEDNGVNFPSTVTPFYNATNKTIIITYTQNISLTAGKTLIIKLEGVESPPTETTTTNANFYVATADANVQKID